MRDVGISATPRVDFGLAHSSTKSLSVPAESEAVHFLTHTDKKDTGVSFCMPVRDAGIEPASPAWEAEILPLN